MNKICIMPLCSRKLFNNSDKHNILSVFKLFMSTLSDEIVIPTTTPNVYCSAFMDAEMTFNSYKAKANEIFSLTPKYVPPSEFNYNLPTGNIPELAFIGRSNVGKSSLISALLGAKKLVNISKSPGCTKSINYYAFTRQTGSHFMYMVDLPGYGFAHATKLERENWSKMIKDYFKARDFFKLRRVYVLIDSRRGIGKLDCQMLDILHELRQTYQIILTKSDLKSSTSLNKILHNLFDEIMGGDRVGCMPVVHIVSAVKGDGMQALKLSLAETISQSFQKFEG